MRYAKNSIKFQTRKSRALAARNRPSGAASMTPCAATKRNIGHRRNYGVSPRESLLCRNVPGQKRRRLSPASPLSPLHKWSLPTSHGCSSSCKMKGGCWITGRTLTSSAQQTGSSWTASAPTGKRCCSICKQTNRVKKRTLVRGHDRRRGQLSYARRQALEDLFVDGTLRHAHSK